MAKEIENGTYGRFTTSWVSMTQNGVRSLGYTVSFPYDAREVGRVRAIKGAKWIGIAKVWFVPAGSFEHLRALMEIDARTYVAPDARSERYSSVAHADSQGLHTREDGTVSLTD